MRDKRLIWAFLYMLAFAALCLLFSCRSNEEAVDVYYYRDTIWRAETQKETLRVDSIIHDTCKIEIGYDSAGRAKKIYITRHISGRKTRVFGRSSGSSERAQASGSKRVAKPKGATKIDKGFSLVFFPSIVLITAIIGIAARARR